MRLVRCADQASIRGSGDVEVTPPKPIYDVGGDVLVKMKAGLDSPNGLRVDLRSWISHIWNMTPAPRASSAGDPMKEFPIQRRPRARSRLSVLASDPRSCGTASGGRAPGSGGIRQRNRSLARPLLRGSKRYSQNRLRSTAWLAERRQPCSRAIAHPSGESRRGDDPLARGLLSAGRDRPAKLPTPGLVHD